MRSQMKRMDLFADVLWQFYATGKADLRIERDDGYLRREDVSWYFTLSCTIPSLPAIRKTTSCVLYHMRRLLSMSILRGAVQVEWGKQLEQRRLLFLFDRLQKPFGFGSG